jgi:hypothetical protein
MTESYYLDGGPAFMTSNSCLWWLGVTVLMVLSWLVTHVSWWSEVTVIWWHFHDFNLEAKGAPSVYKKRYYLSSKDIRNTTRAINCYAFLLTQLYVLARTRCIKKASEIIIIVRYPARDRQPIRFLGSMQCDCLIDIDSLVTSTCSRELIHLLLGGCSRDCTANINRHRIPINYIEHTYNKMSRVNGAISDLSIGPPHGTYCYSFLCMLFYCLLLLWVFMHICTYLSSYIMLYFWIKLNMKMSKFLTD